MSPYVGTDSEAVVLEKSTYRGLGMDLPAPWFASTVFKEISTSRPLGIRRGRGGGSGI